MLVTCAGKALKQPVEIEIPDEEYEKIKKLGSEGLQNDAIASWAMKHVKKYGYDLGRCKERSCNVDFNSCISCGLRQGQNRVEWEKCKYKNLEYKYPNSKTTLKAQKPVMDEKTSKKLELTPEELAMASNLYLTDK